MIRTTALVILALLCLSSCAGPFNRTLPERHFFVMQARLGDPAGQMRPILAGSTLKVQQFRSSPRFDEKELVYRTGESTFDSDYYNAFFITPSANITAEVRKCMAGCAVFAHVVEPSSEVDASHVLEGSVNEIYGDFRDRSAPKAVMELQFLLLKDARLDYSILFQHTYRKEIPLESATPADLVKGLNRALSEILADLQSDLNQANLAKK